MADVSEHPRSKLDLVQESIQLALSARWEEAVALNQDLLDRFGADEDTHNRLGKALMELGRMKEAQGHYESALEINPLNQIAKRQLARLAELRASRPAAAAAAEGALPPRFFTEEPGKTTITKFAAIPGVDATTVGPGEAVELVISEAGVVAKTARGVDLGALEPKLAQRLRQLSEGGNRYQGGVTRVEASSVAVLVREVHQAPALAGTVSFPVRKGREPEYRPYAKEALLVHDGEPIVMEDEDSELIGAPPSRGTQELGEGFEEFEEGAEDLEENEEEELEAEEEF